MGDQVCHESQQDRDEQPVQNETVERQIERVEADVQVELRIGDTECLAVEEQLDSDPVGLRDETGQDADRYRNDHAEQTKTRHDGGAVARDRIIGSGDRDEHRACAVREKHREPHDGADDNSDDQEEHESRQQNLVKTPRKPTSPNHNQSVYMPISRGPTSSKAATTTATTNKIRLRLDREGKPAGGRMPTCHAPRFGDAVASQPIASITAATPEWTWPFPTTLRNNGHGLTTRRAGSRTEGGRMNA